MTPAPTSQRLAVPLPPCSPQQQRMLVALLATSINRVFAARNGYVRKSSFRGRIEIGRHLSRHPPRPTFSPNTREGRVLMRRIIAAIAALVALILGGGAGFNAY